MDVKWSERIFVLVPGRLKLLSRDYHGCSFHFPISIFFSLALWLNIGGLHLHGAFAIHVGARTKESSQHHPRQSQNYWRFYISEALACRCQYHYLASIGHKRLEDGRNQK